MKGLRESKLNEASYDHQVSKIREELVQKECNNSSEISLKDKHKMTEYLQILKEDINNLKQLLEFSYF